MTLLDEAATLAHDTFTDPDLAGFIKLAVLRKPVVGDLDTASLTASVEAIEIRCRALLNSHDTARQQAMAIDPRAETWWLEGVTLDAAADVLHPPEGGVLVIEDPYGSEDFIHEGELYHKGRARAVVSAADVTVGGGVLWEVVAVP